MADEIYVSAGALSSGLLKKVKSNLKSAIDKMNRLDSGAAMQKASYNSPVGSLPIFDAEMVASAVRIDLEIKKLEATVEQYAAILDSGPEALEEIDKSCKSKMTSWWERTTYSAEQFINSIFSFGTKTGGTVELIDRLPDLPSESDAGWSGFVTEEKLAVINQYDAEWVEQYREEIEKLAHSYMGAHAFLSAMEQLYKSTIGPIVVVNDNSNYTSTRRSEAIIPPKSNSMEFRSKEAYREVMNALEVETNPRYDNTGINTYCNIYVWDVTSAMGCEIPHWDNGKELNADEMGMWLSKYGNENGWIQIDETTALQKANEGHPTVACSSGHIAMVSPSEAGDVKAYGSEIYLSQAGAIYDDYNGNNNHIPGGYVNWEHIVVYYYHQ